MWLPQLGEDGGPLGPGPHDVHLAPQHVQQLGQLVQPVLAQHPPHRGDPGVVLRRPTPRPLLALGVDVHRAELVDGERPAPQVPGPAVVLGRRPGRAAVEPDPLLG